MQLQILRSRSGLGLLVGRRTPRLPLEEDELDASALGTGVGFRGTPSQALARAVVVPALTALTRSEAVELVVLAQRLHFGVVCLAVGRLLPAPGPGAAGERALDLLKVQPQLIGIVQPAVARELRGCDGRRIDADLDPRAGADGGRQPGRDRSPGGTRVALQ